MAQGSSQQCGELFAHSPNAEGEWQSLEDHLRNVSRMARGFAEPFSAAYLGEIAGLLHDIGKANPDFQDYLLKSWRAEKEGGKKPKSTPHSIYGGIALAEAGMQLPSFAVAGHHGGLANLCDIKPKLSEKKDERWLSDAILRLHLDGPQQATLPEYAKDALPCELLIRMLFSALVDADWLDTEAHFNPEKTALRAHPVFLSDLWDRFEADQVRLITRAGIEQQTEVNRARREIYEACIYSADGPQGVYRLTVPTGGGKTRSGMGFALRHAIKHGLDRIIFAIPYTSIIDQTADVYQGIFGPENVLEHHSAIEPTLDPSEGESEAELRRQLASENWDAPIIVTTTVQLFESLFSNRPSRCRKLHSIARSVLVLDEVQTLPIHLLKPTLDILRELVDHYGVTLVLSTATQPAFSGESPYLRGFTPEPVEIVPNPGRYFQALKRVDYKIEDEPWSWSRVAEEIRQTDQALCVVNSRRDAVALYRLLDDPTALHLSTLMCPAHRRDVLHDIRRRLERGEPCRVVSTQVVEAGVDLDFPVVLRAVGPLDRIVQAAGRCNREGKLDVGRVVVFQPVDGRAPRGVYEIEMQIAQDLLRQPAANPDNPEFLLRYFADVYRIVGRKGLDKKNITYMREEGLYEQVARAGKLIEEDTVSVIVPYDKGLVYRLIADIGHRGHALRDDYRTLQSHSVSLYRNQFQEYMSDGLVQEIGEGLNLWKADYHRKVGLCNSALDPADLVA